LGMEVLKSTYDWILDQTGIRRWHLLDQLIQLRTINLQSKGQYSCANIVQWKPPATKLKGGVYTPTYFVRHDIIRFEESFWWCKLVLLYFEAKNQCRDRNTMLTNFGQGGVHRKEAWRRCTSSKLFGRSVPVAWETDTMSPVWTKPFRSLSLVPSSL